MGIIGFRVDRLAIILKFCQSYLRLDLVEKHEEGSIVIGAGELLVRISSLTLLHMLRLFICAIDMTLWCASCLITLRICLGLLS